MENAPCCFSKGDLSVIKNNKKGFTLAELLVVVAIIGILVAVSIPIFSAQKKKAIVATNQSNIRAAKASAMAEMYDGDATVSFTNTDKGIPTYFLYDIQENKIIKTIIGNYREGNKVGKECYQEAISGKICTKIAVYIGNPNTTSDSGKTGATIQTAPFYTENNEIGINGNNPYGPNPGSSKVDGGV